MTTSRTGTSQHKAWRRAVLTRDHDRGQTTCPDCGRPLAWGTSRQPDSPEPDHIRPWARGGRNDYRNLLPSCRSCNSDKRTLTLTEWAQDRASRGKPPVKTTWDSNDPRYWYLTIPDVVPPLTLTKE